MLAALMVVLCIVFRVVPHPANFTPVGAAAVFAGRTLPPRYAVPLILLTMLASDLALTRIHGMSYFSGTAPFVYAGFAAQALLGRWLRRRRGGAICAALLGATAFFALSNFGVWLGGMYGHTTAGLVACYAAAIPFFGATLAGDLVWTLILSIAYRSIARRLSPRWSRWVAVPPSEIENV